MNAIQQQRFLVIMLSVLLLLGGVYAFRQLNIEAYPDPSPPTIEIIAQNSGWSAEDMERQVTIPLETQLNGMPGLSAIRSISLFGLSNIKCYFTYDTDYDYARQEVLNRLPMAPLPEGVRPELSPWSAIGEIYRYQLVGEGYDVMELKVVQDWILERQFRQVPGVIDVVGFGGPTREFHVELDPNLLISYDLSVPEVMEAISESNSNVGANYLEIGAQSYNVRGIALFRDAEDIANVLVKAKDGTPVYVGQLGQVGVGSRVRMGQVGKDDESDIVQGIVMMRRGEQSLPALERVRAKVEELNRGILPEGMQVVPYYDRTDLINVTTRTVTLTLTEGMVLVGFVVLAFLGNLRAALVITLSVPLSLLFTFVIMVLRGDSANLISMGAIDLGIIVDASVVVVENICRHLSLPGRQHADVRETAAIAAKEVFRPVCFSTAIIVTGFLPLFTMTGVEGRIFSPMAVTYGLALTGALLLAFTFSPAMASLLLKPGHSERETFFMRWNRKLYEPLLEKALARPGRTVSFAAVALVGVLAVAPFLGGEFMPALEEGNLWVRATLPNTISFDYAVELADDMRATLSTYPEVVTVVSQLGRPDEGTEAVSFFNCDFFINLKPPRQWRRGLTKEGLIEEMESDLRQFPGVTFNFSQNIQDNVQEAMSGIRGENSIKLFGEDLDRLEEVANRIVEAIRDVHGVADLGIYQMLGQPNLLIRVDREQSARYGVLPDDVNGVVQAAVGGQAVTQLYEGDRRFDVVVRFLPEYRGSVDAIADIPVRTRDGGRVPLKQVAEISRETGASFIYREDNARYLPIKFSVRGRDLRSTVSEVRERIDRSAGLPAGYRYEIAGEFQQLQEALARLKIVVPLSLLIILFLLYSTFRSFTDALLLMIVVPLATMGGLVTLLATGTDFSISAAVGFISLFGVSVLLGVILVSRIRQLREEGLPLEEALSKGSKLLLRPVLMAALAAALGLLPASVATGIGSETQRPLARVVVGGMLTAAPLILLVLPSAYLLIHRRRRETRIWETMGNSQ